MHNPRIAILGSAGCLCLNDMHMHSTLSHATGQQTQKFHSQHHPQVPLERIVLDVVHPRHRLNLMWVRGWGGQSR